MAESWGLVLATPPGRRGTGATVSEALLLQLLPDSQQEFSATAVLIMVLRRSGREKICHKTMSVFHPDQLLAISNCQVFPCLALTLPVFVQLSRELVLAATSRRKIINNNVAFDFEMLRIAVFQEKPQPAHKNKT